MAKSVAKKQHGGDRGNPYLKTVEGQVIPPAKMDADIYIESISKTGGSPGRPTYLETEQQLIDGIADYLRTLQDVDGKYCGAPSMRGLGAYLGYASSSWHAALPYQDVLNHFRLWIDGWRINKMTVPRGGINPAAIMFLLANGIDKADDDKKDVTPLADDRPEDAAALIETVWRKKDA